MYIFLTILYFIISLFPCKYTQEELCIALSTGFQNMAVQGQRKSTGHSDGQRKEA